MRETPKKIHFLISTIFLLSLIVLYFNALSIPNNSIGIIQSETSDCSFDEGTAGPGKGKYQVCQGEDFWLPDQVEKSPYASVGVWSNPVNSSGERDYTSELAPFVRINWSLDQSNLYDETHASFASQAVRLALYLNTEFHCISLCQMERPENQDSCLKAKPFDSRGRFKNDQTLQDELNAEGLSDLFFLKQAYDFPWYQSKYIGLCDPEFKKSSSYQNQRKKILIDFGEGSLVNGALPASCQIERFDTYINDVITKNFGTKSSLITNEIQSSILNYAARDPNWTKSTEVSNCVETHFGNVLKSLETLQLLDQVSGINFTSEGGNLWNWYVLGENASMSFAEKDQLQIHWIESVTNAVKKTFPDTNEQIKVLNKFFVNFYHGRAFYPLVKSALENKMGIGEHSLLTPFAYSYLQHLPHITYDQNNKRYSIDSTKIPPILHTDLEGMHKQHEDLIGKSRTYLNTWGQYRLYRMSLLTEVALGYNSFTNTGELIPSEGNYQTSNSVYYNGSMTNCHDSTGDSIVAAQGTNDSRRLCNFDYDQINGNKIPGGGALQLYKWLIKIAGRPANDSPEAYCAFHQTGKELNPGFDFIPEDRRLKSTWHWGQKSSTPRYTHTYYKIIEEDYEGYYDFINFDGQFFAPKVTSWGRYCETEGLNLEGGREMNPTLLGPTNPEMSNRVFTGDMDNTNLIFPFEGALLKKTFTNPKNISLKFNEEFLNKVKDEMALKITLSTTAKFCDNYQSDKKARLNLSIENAGITTYNLAISISESLVSFCGNQKFTSISNNQNILIPELFTITVPLSKIETNLNENSSIKLSLSRLSQMEVVVLLVRLIDLNHNK